MLPKKKMLRALRNQTQSIFFKCFLVLLICGFALWGVGDLTGGSKEVPILTTKNVQDKLKSYSQENFTSTLDLVQSLTSDYPSPENWEVAFEKGIIP